MDRVATFASAVDGKVDMGFHFCYGDLQHKHFVEPKDMGLLVEVANETLWRVKNERSFAWIHMPVPKSRVDANYFSPLENLDAGKTDVYLGLLHADDLDGTKKRIEVASGVLSEFGVATECGFGRSDAVELESVLQIASQVTADE